MMSPASCRVEAVARGAGAHEGAGGVDAAAGRRTAAGRRALVRVAAVAAVPGQLVARRTLAREAAGRVAAAAVAAQREHGAALVHVLARAVKGISRNITMP